MFKNSPPVSVTHLKIIGQNLLFKEKKWEHAFAQVHLKSHGVAESEKGSQGIGSLVGSVAP